MSMRLSRRNFLRMSGAAAGAAFLAACGPGGNGAETPVVPATGETLAPGETPAAGETLVATAPAASGSGEAMEFSFWTFVDQHQAFYTKRMAAWNEANPDRPINVTPTAYAYQDMHDKLLIALQSGTGAPDIVDIEIAKFGTFLRGTINLRDLTPMMNKHMDQLMPERAFLYSTGGKIYGAPTHLGATVMFYNDEILQNAGVNVDDIKTWDDFIAAGKEVTTEDVKMTFVESADLFTFMIPALMNGGGLFTEEGQPALYQPANVEALEFVQSLVYEHQIAEPCPGGNMHAAENYEALNAGRCAALWMPQWWMIRYPDNMPDLNGKIKIRPIPPMQEDGFTAAMGGGTGTAVTDQCAEEKAPTAIDFLEFAKITLDGNLAIWKDFRFDPFRYDAYEDPSMSDPDPFFANEAPMQVVKEVAQKLAPHYVGPQYPEVATLIRENVAFDAFTNEADPDATLKSAQERVETM